VPSPDSASPSPDEPPLDPRVVAQARLAAIIESSDDAIVSKTLEGIITSWNKGAERIFGWPANEVIGKSITIIIPQDRLEEEPVILSRIRSGERVDHFETIRQRKDGRLINVSVTISPVRDETGRIIGVSKIARDITQQKQFHEELRAAKDAAERARDEAEAANRAKDHFLSVLSHELRTPLTPVLGAISMMERDGTVPPHLAERVAMIRRNVETEARLVDDLLDLTRITRGKITLHPEVVDVHAILRDVAAMFQPEADEKQQNVALSLHARQHYIWVDAGRFQQVLLNLMSNAVKFTPPNGSITLRTSNENGTVKIEVSDTGIGIEPEVMPRLFRPFEQGEAGVTRQFGGLGLGLSIVKALVEMHKASVSVTSEGRGKGTTFTLRVEAVTEGAANAHKAAQDHPAAPARKALRILLVEDHHDTRYVLSRLLAGLGFEVTAAGSVKEAVEAAAGQSFDLLLSDIGLPDGSGMDVMRQIANRHKVKGIALSGYGQDEDLRRSREAGFVTHLTKPVNLQTLQDAIRKVTE
jgi:PAS domain S-box-containing protein